MKQIIPFLACLVLAFAGCDKKEDAAATPGKLTIAVIPKGTTHEFWKSVEAGAKQAGTERDVNILWKGPLKEDDRAAQIAVVQQFVSDGVSAIVLAPLDENALVRPVREATGKKIPVVIFDSPLAGEAGKDFVSLVATDNVQAGRIGADSLAASLGGKGNVVLLRYIEGSASTMAREKGFLEGIAKHPDIKVLVDNRYAGATADTAKIAALNMLDQLKEANGVFCPNESSAVGMLLALKQSGLSGKVKFVGFDTSTTLITALRAKEIDALVAQNPSKMGYAAVNAAVDQIQGKAPPAGIDTGVQLITLENIDTPEVKTLLGAH